MPQLVLFSWSRWWTSYFSSGRVPRKRTRKRSQETSVRPATCWPVLTFPVSLIGGFPVITMAGLTFRTISAASCKSAFPPCFPFPCQLGPTLFGTSMFGNCCTAQSSPRRLIHISEPRKLQHSSVSAYKARVNRIRGFRHPPFVGFKSFQTRSQYYGVCSEQQPTD